MQNESCVSGIDVLSIRIQQVSVGTYSQAARLSCERPSKSLSIGHPCRGRGRAASQQSSRSPRCRCQGLINDTVHSALLARDRESARRHFSHCYTHLSSLVVESQRQRASSRDARKAPSCGGRGRPPHTRGAAARKIAQMLLAAATHEVGHAETSRVRSFASHGPLGCFAVILVVRVRPARNGGHWLRHGRFCVP